MWEGGSRTPGLVVESKETVISLHPFKRYDAGLLNRNAPASKILRAMISSLNSRPRPTHSCVRVKERVKLFGI